MAEQVYHLTQGNQKTIEKIILDENIHYMHMIFNKGEALPEHPANSNVYMTVLRGTLSLALNDSETNEYTAGTVIRIPYGTKMNARNLHEETLEITVVKAPAPKS